MAKYTGLILITAALSNTTEHEIESSFLETLSPFAIDILDKQSMQIRDRYFLAIFIKLDKAHQRAIEIDLNKAAEELQVDIAFDYRDE